MICYVSLYFMHRTAVIMSVCPSQVNIYSTCIVTDTQTYSQPSDGWYIKTNIKVSRQNISEHVAKKRNTLSVKLWMWASFPWKTLWNTLLRAVGFCAFRQTSNIWPPCSIADKMKTNCSIFKWIPQGRCNRKVWIFRIWNPFEDWTNSFHFIGDWTGGSNIGCLAERTKSDCS